MFFSGINDKMERNYSILVSSKNSKSNIYYSRLTFAWTRGYNYPQEGCPEISADIIKERWMQFDDFPRYGWATNSHQNLKSISFASTIYRSDTKGSRLNIT